MTDKPNLTRVWAGTAPGGNVVDPDTVTAGKFAAGWQAEVPPFEYFNFIQKQVTEGLAHINEQGIAVWDTNTVYPVGGLAKGSDGNVYKALISQNDNDPVSDNGTNWIDELNNRVIRVTSIADVKELTGVSEYQVSLIGLTAGIFEFSDANLSIEVSDDVNQYSYIAPSSDPTGSSGAWVRQTIGEAIHRDSVADVKAIPVELTQLPLRLTDKTRFGEWYFDPSDLSALSGSDPQEGVIIFPSFAPSGTSGAWRRVYVGPLKAEWFGAVNHTYPSGTEDSTIAFQACADYAGEGGSWVFSGKHRITSEIEIPFRQTFGSFGISTSIALAIMSSPTDFQGVTGGTGNFTNSVFFDSETGSAFKCNEGAVPHDFTIYGLGYNELGLDTNQGQPGSKFYDTIAFLHGKYINPRNIVCTLFRRFSSSESIGAGGNFNGDYYSTYNNCEVIRCHTAFRVSSTDSYNTKVNDCRIDVSRFGDFGVGTRNFVVYGGSYEGYSEVTFIRNRSTLSFFGTYMEASRVGLFSEVFRVLGSTTSLKFDSCLVYLNNFNVFARELDGTSINTVISTGCTFVSGEDGILSKIIFKFSNTEPSGALFGDTVVVPAGYSVTYAPGNTVSNMLYNPPA